MDGKHLDELAIALSRKGALKFIGASVLAVFLSGVAEARHKKRHKHRRHKPPKTGFVTQPPPTVLPPPPEACLPAGATCGPGLGRCCPGFFSSFCNQLDLCGPPVCTCFTCTPRPPPLLKCDTPTCTLCSAEKPTPVTCSCVLAVEDGRPLCAKPAELSDGAGGTHLIPCTTQADCFVGGSICTDFSSCGPGSPGKVCANVCQGCPS
jgi:hypothetical protein